MRPGLDDRLHLLWLRVGGRKRHQPVGGRFRVGGGPVGQQPLEGGLLVSAGRHGGDIFRRRIQMEQIAVATGGLQNTLSQSAVGQRCQHRHQVRPVAPGQLAAGGGQQPRLRLARRQAQRISRQALRIVPRPGLGQGGQRRLAGGIFLQAAGPFHRTGNINLGQ